MKKVNSVEEYLEVNSYFGEGLSLLRHIINTTELEEHLKWNAPVYSLNGKNVVGLGAFKTHFGIWFFNGVFLKDKKNLLELAQEKTKGMRQMRFTSLQEINEEAVLYYLKEAIDNQKLGKEIKPHRLGKKVDVPTELKKALNENSTLQAAFNQLKQEIDKYIIYYYNERIKSNLNKMSPIKYRSHYYQN